MSQKNELRIFVSSTFRDMQEEREHLVKKIFPEIRALCRERGIIFTEIDLRWGLTEEEASLGRIIRSCLEEIDRCRPYFFCILGSRYGWIPELHEIYTDADLLRQYPWIEDMAMEESSIVEMEVEHGALADPDAAREYARFFFRRQRRRLEDDQGDAEEKERMEELKDRIEDAGMVVETFRDPVSLGELIYDELIEIIKRDFADVLPLQELERERAQHLAFSASRRRAYIPNPANLKRLNEFAAGNGPPMLLYAQSGMGKSSLVAHWAELYRQNNPDVVVVQHYIGVGGGERDHLGIIRHVMREIKELTGREDEVPTSANELRNEFGRWLDSVDQKRMVLVLDGLNQLDVRDQLLTWLPEKIPATIRLIATSTLEDTRDLFRSREWNEFEIQFLGLEERKALIVRFLREFHKGLSREQIVRIAENEKASHPIFLRTLLEELRLHGTHEHLDHRIDYYLDSADTSELFQLVLERLEADYSTREVREVMSLLWASRGGLTEGELSEITGYSRMKISALVYNLDYHLIKREEMLTFFHNYLRVAVQKRYLPDEESQRKAQLRVAGYLEGLPIDDRIAYELPWLLYSAGAFERLWSVLAAHEVIAFFKSAGDVHLLLGYWRNSDGLEQMAAYYTERCEQLDTPAADPQIAGDYFHHVCEFLRLSGFAPAAVPIARKLVKLREERLGPEHADTAWSLNNLAVVLQEVDSNDEEVEPLLQRSMEIRRKVLGEDHPLLAGSLNNLGTHYVEHDRLEEASLVLHQAYDIWHHHYGLHNRNTLYALNNLAHVMKGMGEVEKAIELFEQVLDARRKLFGPEHPSVATVLLSLAMILEKVGRDDEAKEMFEQSSTMGKRLLGLIHPHTIIMVSAQAEHLKKIGQPDEAAELYQDILPASIDHLGEEDHQSVQLAGHLAMALAEADRFDEAIERIKRAIEVCEEKLGETTPNLAFPLATLGTIYMEQDKLSLARKTFERVLEVERANGTAHAYSATSAYHLLGKVAAREGKVEEAVMLFEEALEIIEPMAGEDNELVKEIYQDMEAIRGKS